MPRPLLRALNRVLPASVALASRTPREARVAAALVRAGVAVTYEPSAISWRAVAFLPSLSLGRPELPA